MKEKIKNAWKRFKNFYKRNYEKNKVLTIILTIIAIPILLLALLVLGYVILLIVVLILTLWFMKILFFGFSKKSKSSSVKVKEPSGKSCYGYSEEEIITLINTEPVLRGVNDLDWEIFAEALNESKYIREIKVMYANKLPIYIFPYDKKPRINAHFLDENTIDSSGGWFEKAQQHFTTKELNNGEICIIYKEKRLTSKDI